MKINKKILAIAMTLCLPVSILIANCASGYTPPVPPEYADPTGDCDETCTSDLYAIDGACGATVSPGGSGRECSYDVVYYGHSEYAPRLHWDDEEEVWYCSCDEVSWDLEYYLNPHLGSVCTKPIIKPSDPPVGG